MFTTKCWLTQMIEIAAMAFNKIVLLFFYNIKHLKFQSSNTTDHWSNKNTHIDYWVVRMQYQKSFFLHIIQLVGYILTVCCRIFQSKPKNPRGLLIFLSEYMLYQSEFVKKTIRHQSSKVYTGKKELFKLKTKKSKGGTLLSQKNFCLRFWWNLKTSIFRP